jgi:UPF0042 nucleotide-binding protein
MSSKRRLFVVSGLSGAGKSQALKVFEDFDFFCVDNLPMALIDEFSNLLMRFRYHDEVALGMDIRGQKYLDDLGEAIKKVEAKGWVVRVLYLDASEKVLVQRFSETRHRHPLGKSVLPAIREERRALAPVKGMADKVIDTSNLTLGELKEKIGRTLEMKRSHEMNLSVVSFGYKHGLPMDADLVMDVRFLPNPNYQPNLKKKTGLDKPVQNYIRKQAATKDFLTSYTRMIKRLLPHYVREGKSYLTLAIGCTGGRHRSVYMAHYLAEALKKNELRVSEFHRDLNK